MMMPRAASNLAFFATVLFATMAASPVARAACPSPYDDDVCDPISSNICDLSGVTWECDVSGSVAGANVTVVSDYSTDYLLEAWGDLAVVEGGSTVRYQFCCEISDSSIEEVQIQGSPYGDNLALTYDSLTYNLVGTANFSATVLGGDGNDSILGTDDYNNRFYEYLYGEGGNDSVRGHNGYLDYLYGGDGADLMYGGPGPDQMEGGPGDDIMLGGAGDDTMDGDAQADVMSGGPGNDTMDGGIGLDVLCGDSGADSLDDGDTVADNELLWADSDTGDSVTCGTTSTQEGSGTFPSFCAATALTSRPTACP